MDVDSLETFEECFLVLEDTVEMTKYRDFMPKDRRLKAVDAWLECPPDEEEQSACCQAKKDGLGQQQLNNELCQCHYSVRVLLGRGWMVKRWRA